MADKNFTRKSISDLFEQADKRIFEFEDEKTKLLLMQEEAKKILVKETTEKYADSVLSLVSDILSTTTSREGRPDIAKYEIMGSTIMDDELNSFHYFGELARNNHTKYTIDDNGLKIILNYSRFGEGCVDETYGGSFDDENIDYNYLEELLNPCNIHINKVDIDRGDGGTGEYENIKFIEIIVSREKTLKTENAQRKKY